MHELPMPLASVKDVCMGVAVVHPQNPWFPPSLYSPRACVCYATHKKWDVQVGFLAVQVPVSREWEGRSVKRHTRTCLSRCM
jgi:hypothetical protein